MNDQKAALQEMHSNVAEAPSRYTHKCIIDSEPVRIIKDAPGRAQGFVVVEGPYSGRFVAHEKYDLLAFKTT